MNTFSQYSEKTLRDVQLLMAQVIHDLISSFTSLSAGVDLVQNPENEIWKLICEAKEQLQLQLVLSRFLFGYTEGSAEEANWILEMYIRKNHMKLSGVITESPKLMLGMAFWLIKQNQCRRSAELLIEGKQIMLSSRLIRTPSHDDEIFLGELSCQTPRESYASYLYHLAQSKGIDIRIERKNQRIMMAAQEKRSKDLTTAENAV